MKNDSRIQASATQEATWWFLRLRAPDCTPHERQAFDVWLRNNPIHRREYAALQSLWDRMSVLEVNPLPEFESIFAQRTRELSKWSVFDHLPRALALAMLLLVIGGAWWWSANQVTVTSYHTALGERETVTVADGTVIELNTNTSLSVYLSTHECRVVLEEGEAYFTVAYDEERPFIVDTYSGHIRDIGTRFSVRTDKDRVSVAVEEGAVQITLVLDDQHPGMDAVRELEAGELVRYARTGRWSDVEQIDPQLIAAWRQGKLVFEGIPLNDAIQEIKRYWPGQIILADAALADIEVRGVIEIQNLANFFHTLPDMLPIEVTHDTTGRIMLSKR